MNKSLFQKIRDFVLFPVRVMFPNNEFGITHILKLTSLADERYNIVLENCKGKTLDIGCGNNEVIRRYVSKGKVGWGLDIMYNKNVDIVCIVNEIRSFLPFKNDSFDTICFVGCLNHIPNREHMLLEASRILKKDGHVIITMISPFIGCFGHRILWRYWGDPDQHESGRKIEEGEKWGLPTLEIKTLAEKAGLKIAEIKKFVYGFNNLYILKKHNI